MGRIAIARLDEILALRRAPNQWRGGRTREVFIPNAGRIGFQGYVEVDLIDAKSGLIKQHLSFFNLITDAALDAFGANNQLSNFLNGFIGVGTGSTAPANSDVGLQTPVGVRVNTVGGGTESNGWGAANAYSFRRMVREFSEAQSNGNLTEFGVFNASSGGTMLARQLFKDGSGNPTVITKTTNDKLRITYEFRLYPPTVDTSGTANVSGTNYNWTGRATNIGVDSAWGWGGATGALVNFGKQGNGTMTMTAFNSTGLGASTGGGVTGATQSANSDSSTFTAYVNGNHYAEYTQVWNVGSANFTGGSGGVSGFQSQPFSTAVSTCFQMQLATFIPKVNTQKLTLIFRYSWGRH